MAEPEKKDYARRCESHVEALRAAVPGAIEKVEWQCEDQLTITVKQDKLPEAVHYLYYERYGWIPVIVGAIICLFPISVLLLTTCSNPGIIYRGEPPCFTEFKSSVCSSLFWSV